MKFPACSSSLPAPTNIEIASGPQASHCFILDKRRETQHIWGGLASRCCMQAPRKSLSMSQLGAARTSVLRLIRAQDMACRAHAHPHEQ